MKKDLEIWQFVASRLKRKQSAMLLVVAESAGSSPGRQGFKMAVAADDLSGSIGGGLMEVNLVELAREILQGTRHKAKGEIKTKNPGDSAFPVPHSAIVEQVHQKNSPVASGMICSGRQTVIFFKLNPPQLKIVREIVSALKNYQAKTLRISDSEFQIAETAPDKPDFRFEQKGEGSFLFEEKLGFKNRLFIVGGGHCALALSELAAKMDFHIALFDDRPFLNTLAKNKFVHEKKIIESYERIGDFIPSGPDVYVVVMTLGYKSDEIVIRRLFDRDFKYFGVLGSRAKMKTLLKNLRREGFSPERLDRIRTPIGLPINSRTPEEIAVSIAAEIIAVKNGR
ncbi:MAG TPA: XdhC family protein [Pyrinomonadaceae bacterium]|jgi:xanthine dehydrogenase accessory factor